VKIDWAFLRLVLYCALGVVALVVLPLSVYSGKEILHSVVASGLASLFHLLLGYVLIEFGFDKPNTTFLMIILGGTFLRTVLLVGFVFILVRIYQFHAVSLMISFLFFFALNLALEIHVLHKKVALKR
jgi:hypothetical protein